MFQRKPQDNYTVLDSPAQSFIIFLIDVFLNLKGIKLVEQYFPQAGDEVAIDDLLIAFHCLISKFLGLSMLWQPPFEILFKSHLGRVGDALIGGFGLPALFLFHGGTETAKKIVPVPLPFALGVGPKVNGELVFLAFNYLFDAGIFVDGHRGITSG